MHAIRISGTAVLSLLLGIAAPAYAQREQQGEKQDHPQQQSKHEQARSEQHHAQRQRQPAQEQQPAQHVQQRRQDQNKHTQHRAQQQQRQDQNNEQRASRQPRGNQRPEHTRQQQRVERSVWQQHRSQNWQSDHRTWQQRGGYTGYRIPDDRYRGYFGQNHRFRIYGLPFLVVGGYPRFQYEGYWFSMIDPWPGYWGNDWYDRDDVYVMYVNNGYYLFNRRYPNVGIAIDISM